MVGSMTGRTTVCAKCAHPGANDAHGVKKANGSPTVLRGVRRLVFEKEHLLTQLDALFAEAASESLFSFVSEDVQEVERLCGQLFLGAL